MAGRDFNGWIVVRLAEGAGWSAERVEDLRGAHSRLATLARAEEYRSPEAMMLLGRIREERRHLEADATKEMLQISLAHDEARLGELHQIRSTATGPRASAVDRGIDRITTHADEIGERLARL